jgi:hypothetical protein
VYCVNNPLKFVDPSGFCPEDGEFVIRSLGTYAITPPIVQSFMAQHYMSQNFFGGVKKDYDFMKQIYSDFPDYIKNTQTFITSYGNRIPEFLNDKIKIIGDIKNVAYQSLTSQIKGFLQIAREQGKTFVLVVSQGTRLSKPLIDAISEAGGKIVRIGDKAIKSISVPVLLNKDVLDAYLNQLQRRSGSYQEIY